MATSASVQKYLDLVTSAFRLKPKFQAVVTLNTSVQTAIQNALYSAIALLDLDTTVGVWLDYIGSWVGITRNVSVPITGVYFSWDSNAALGWNSGSWQPNNLPATVTSLPDDAFRTLIRAKIAANQWDGTTEGAYAIWRAVSPDVQILIQDNQDMTYRLGFYGGTINALLYQLIIQGYIPLRPEGVRMAGVFTPYDAGPIFAWDSNSTALKGWDTGAWATITNL